MKETVCSLQAQINALEAEKYAIEKGILDKNEVKLVEEILNLISGVGVISADYYAPLRYYSAIEGVKNIRRNGDSSILVKVESPKGLLLPKQVTIGNDTYDICVIFSKNFEEGLDY